VDDTTMYPTCSVTTARTCVFPILTRELPATMGGAVACAVADESLGESVDRDDEYDGWTIPVSTEVGRHCSSSLPSDRVCLAQYVSTPRWRFAKMKNKPRSGQTGYCYSISHVCAARHKHALVAVPFDPATPTPPSLGATTTARPRRPRWLLGFPPPFDLRLLLFVKILARRSNLKADMSGGRDIFFLANSEDEYRIKCELLWLK
jgi:hypothetical protein